MKQMPHLQIIQCIQDDYCNQFRSHYNYCIIPVVQTHGALPVSLPVGHPSSHELILLSYLVEYSVWFLVRFF